MQKLQNDFNEVQRKVEVAVKQLASTAPADMQVCSLIPSLLFAICSVPVASPCPANNLFFFIAYPAGTCHTQPDAFCIGLDAIAARHVDQDLSKVIPELQPFIAPRLSRPFFPSLACFLCTPFLLDISLGSFPNPQGLFPGCILQIRACDDDVEGFLRRCREAKNEMTCDVHEQLVQISGQQSRIRDMRNKLAVFQVRQPCSLGRAQHHQMYELVARSLRQPLVCFLTSIIA